MKYYPMVSFNGQWQPCLIISFGTKVSTLGHDLLRNVSANFGINILQYFLRRRMKYEMFTDNRQMMDVKWRLLKNNTEVFWLSTWYICIFTIPVKSHAFSVGNASSHQITLTPIIVTLTQKFYEFENCSENNKTA